MSITSVILFIVGVIIVLSLVAFWPDKKEKPTESIKKQPIESKKPIENFVGKQQIKNKTKTKK